ncbi:Golgi to ER traffic protein 4 homolog [Coccinella septempunctata]|uniref:Golgi to ER traffic protein 4 homolog n=1 Tax=Coccinella septempunctata TaxID=41139 RepID=UPI001D08A9D7|nr:Golgi to ER traffic protein 4 homolog [Coccinella septempunctata]
MASQGERGVPRILTKLENSIKSGNYYEAHQMYRTLYFRYLGQEKYDDLYQMLYNGSLLFLDHDQQICGADLAKLLVDVLIKAGETNVVKWSSKLCNIFSKLDPSNPERDTFMASAIKWSAKDSPRGNPFLHQCIAEIYWKEKNYSQARHHYMLSNDGESCAKMLIEYHMKYGYRRELDLFITQAVLQYLSLNNLGTANEVFETYVAQHPLIKRNKIPFSEPLLNFSSFILTIINKNNFGSFLTLCELYEIALKKDPSYADMVERVGQVFFGIKQREDRNQGIFGNLFDMLRMRTRDSDSDDDSAFGTSSSSRMSNRLLDNTDLD